MQIKDFKAKYKVPKLRANILKIINSRDITTKKGESIKLHNYVIEDKTGTIGISNIWK